VARPVPTRSDPPRRLAVFPLHPETIITDKLVSNRGAARTLNPTDRYRPGGMRANNRAENSHLPIRRRERKMRKFKSQRAGRRFRATHAAVDNTFNLQPHLISRRTLRRFRADAFQAWDEAMRAA